MKRPKKAETEALARTGTRPVVIPRKFPWEKTLLAREVSTRSGQSFVYHVVQLIQSWDQLQDGLNERQRDLESLYGPLVELVNVYRHNTVKDGAQRVIAIFKVFLGPPG